MVYNQCESGIKVGRKYRTSDDWLYRCQRKKGHKNQHLFLVDKEDLKK